MNKSGCTAVVEAVRAEEEEVAAAARDGASAVV